jgi:hypothetical protein
VKKQTTEGNEIVAVGGRRGGVYINTVEIFNMKTLSWRRAGAIFVSCNLLIVSNKQQLNTL